MRRATDPAPSESRLHGLAGKMGYRLEKCQGDVWRVNDRLGYVIIDPRFDICVAGANEGLDPEAVEDYLTNILPENI